MAGRPLILAKMERGLGASGLLAPGREARVAAIRLERSRVASRLRSRTIPKSRRRSGDEGGVARGLPATSQEEFWSIPTRPCSPLAHYVNALFVAAWKAPLPMENR
jgi:hypothetical protein